MNRTAKYLKFLSLALVLARSVCPLVAGEPLAFALVSEAKVDSSGIFLRQIVSPSSATLPQIRLAPAPPMGQTTSLSRRQIIDLAKEAAPQLETTNWTGPDIVRVTRQTRPVDEAELTALLRSTLQRDYVGEREARLREREDQRPALQLAGE